MVNPEVNTEEVRNIWRTRCESLIVFVRAVFAVALVCMSAGLCLFFLWMAVDAVGSRFYYQVIDSPDVYCQELTEYTSTCSGGFNHCVNITALDTYYLCARRRKYDISPIKLYLLPESQRAQNETYETEVKVFFTDDIFAA